MRFTQPPPAASAGSFFTPDQRSTPGNKIRNPGRKFFRPAVIVALLAGGAVPGSNASAAPMGNQAPAPVPDARMNQSAPAPAPSGDNSATTPEQLRRAGPPPQNATAAELERLGDNLRFQKAYADALDYYRAAIKRGPDSAILHNKAGMAELQMLRYQEARKEFQRSTKMDPKYADAFNNTGVIFYIERNYGKAIRNYKKALEVTETSASFHSNLGTAYFARKDYDKATREYMRALQLDPEIFERKSREGISARMASPEDRARYHYVIAKMYASQHEMDKCLLYLRKAMEENYAGLDGVYTESEFAGLRKDPRFAEMMSRRPPPLPN